MPKRERGDASPRLARGEAAAEEPREDGDAARGDIGGGARGEARGDAASGDEARAVGAPRALRLPVRCCCCCDGGGSGGGDGGAPLAD